MRLYSVVILIILLSGFVVAESLYSADSLLLEITTAGNFELIAEENNARVELVQAELLLYPEEDFRQSIKKIDHEGKLKEDILLFEWKGRYLGEKDFGYTALIETQNVQKEVRRKIAYPIKEITGFEDYLAPTEKIDSSNPAIRKMAAELAEGEDDLFKVAFNLASWVDQNVEYDLNTLTAEASQSASWVLENRQGVCDEMTSLFIAMARSLGIPARFVKGVSYTNSELFDEPWQAHGWAEVYFPEIGWVSFDITFGQYGYVDVSHIKLRDGFDPSDADTRYEWLARGVRIETSPLDLDVVVKEIGVTVQDPISISAEIVGDTIDVGSYNLIRVKAKNNVNYYTTTTLKLAVPTELEIIGNNRRTLLFGPDEEKETDWVIYVPSTLEKGFSYTFPVTVYSERNLSAQDKFRAIAGEQKFSLAEIEALAVNGDEKNFQNVELECFTQEKEGNGVIVSCNVENFENKVLKDVELCIADECMIRDIGINEKVKQEYELETSAGWKNIVASLENKEFRKTTSIQHKVGDVPIVVLDVKAPDVVNLGEAFEVSLDVTKDSFIQPKHVVIIMKGMGMENSWTIESLQEDQEINVVLRDVPLASKSKFKVIARWEDDNGEMYETEQEVIVRAKAEYFWGKVQLFINGVYNLL